MWIIEALSGLSALLQHCILTEIMGSPLHACSTLVGEHALKKGSLSIFNF